MSQSKVMCVLPVNVTRTNYCCVMVNQLKKDLNQLHLEAQRIQLLEEEYNKKLELFLEASKTVDSKLTHLWSMGSQFDFPKSMYVYDFANRMCEAWRNGDEIIAQDVQSVQLVSFTTPSVPLTYILDKIKSGSNLGKETMHKISCHMKCMGPFTTLYNQITPLIARLQDGNIMLRYFLSLCKATPYLRELETIIDRFTASLTHEMLLNPGFQGTNTAYEMTSNEKIITNDKYKQELSAFPYVVQLLTGELLGHKHYLNHHSKIEPVIKHEIPDVTVSCYPRNRLKLPHNMQNIFFDYNNAWNYGGSPMASIATIDNGIQQLSEENVTYHSPNIECQQNNNNRNCQSTVTSEILNQNCANVGVHNQKVYNVEYKNHVISSELASQNKIVDTNEDNGVHKKLIEIKPKSWEEKVVINQKLVSILLVDKSDKENIFQGSRKKSANDDVKGGKNRAKRLPLTKRRKVIRKMRYSPKHLPEVNDLPPIKIPSLKSNLLRPLP